MKPILNCVQSTLLHYLQQQPDLPKTLAILPDTGCALREKIPCAAGVQALRLYVSMPFPLQTAANLTLPCWEKLSLRCTLFQSWMRPQKENFLDLAETISFCISHYPFATDTWEGCFLLDANEPWHWLEVDNGIALQMNFITATFNLIIL